MVRPIAVALLITAVMLIRVAEPAASEAYRPDQIICSLNPGYGIAKLNERWGTSLLDDYGAGHIYLLDIPDGADPDTFDELIETDPACAWAEPNYILQTAEAVRQMVISATGFTYEDFVDQAVFDRIGLDAAHLVTRGLGVNVAVLDTGVDPGHPVFGGRIAAGGYDFVDRDLNPADTANGIDDDGDASVDEGYGHGTMVAGIVSAIAPEAMILPLRVLDDEGRGDAYNISLAIHYAQLHDADVISMSFGVPRYVESIARQLADADAAGVILVAGAGNENREEPAYFPAIDDPVLMIAAVDSTDAKAPFSDYHQHVVVSAPGVAIRSAYPAAAWASGSGCSFATPFVSGEVALIKSSLPSATAEDVRATVVNAVQDIYSIPGNEAYQDRLGSGRLYLPLAVGVTAGIPERIDDAGGAFLFATPNPARSAVVLHLAEAGTAPEGGIAIYDVSGRIVRELLVVRDAAVLWDGRDSHGVPVPSGVYFARSVIAGRPETAGFTLVR